jgi:signal transduction histidine kinase
MVTDITDRRRADERVAEYQNRLRSLASRLVLTEQRERRRIAVFLHDQIGQALAVAKLRLGALREAATPEDKQCVVDEVAEVLDGVIGDIRSATFDLSPPILYELGFEAAVEWLLEKVGQEHRLRVRFEGDGQPKPMAENVRIVLFLAVREVLTNIIKHAQARSASLSILREEDRLCVSIADDGRGFDMASAVWHGGGHGGFGLFSTRERLEHLGGRLEVTSAPGQGTKVTLVAPLEGPPPPVVGGSA